MSTRDKPAYPWLERTELTDYGATQNFGWYGLTRRELFVKDLACAFVIAESDLPNQAIASHAENLADMLIARLDK